MQFSIGYLKSQNQAYVKSFGINESKAKIIDFSDLDSEPLKALVVPQELFNGQIMSELKDQTKYYPIVSSQDLGLNEDSFEALNDNEAKLVIDKTQYKWILENNLFLLEELFSVVSHLRSLIKENRVTFFEELWYILKTNLGAQDFKVIFNDINLRKEEGKKNDLVTLKIEGQKTPNPSEAQEEDTFILENFKKSLSDDFQIIDFDSEKGKFMAGLNIIHSPCLFIGNISQFTPIQRGLITSLFKGINNELPAIH